MHPRRLVQPPSPWSATSKIRQATSGPTASTARARCSGTTRYSWVTTAHRARDRRVFAMKMASTRHLRLKGDHGRRNALSRIASYAIAPTKVRSRPGDDSEARSFHEDRLAARRDAFQAPAVRLLPRYRALILATSPLRSSFSRLATIARLSVRSPFHKPSASG
jgi:hypothetical protein